MILELNKGFSLTNRNKTVDPVDRCEEALAQDRLVVEIAVSLP